MKNFNFVRRFLRIGVKGKTWVISCFFEIRRTRWAKATQMLPLFFFLLALLIGVGGFFFGYEKLLTIILSELKII